jgi:hypothetical protein
MPEMQEQFPAQAMDRVYAGNAGAISGGCFDGCRTQERRTLAGKCRSKFPAPLAEP